MSAGPELPGGKCTWLKNRLSRTRDGCGTLPWGQLASSVCRLQSKTPSNVEQGAGNPPREVLALSRTEEDP